MLTIAFAAGIGLLAAVIQTPPAQSPERSAEELTRLVTALDGAVFDSFNRCSDPAQLARHASYFAEDVEFYHDTGGVRRPC